MPSLDELAFEAEQDIGRTKAFFPILARLGNLWAATRPWEGRTVALNVHLTTLSAAFIKELTLGGAHCVVSAANPATTDPGTVQLLRNSGVEVFTAGDRKGERHRRALAHQPHLLVDTNLDLIETALEMGVQDVAGAVVTSRSAVDRLRALPTAPPFGVVNLIDGRLHDAVENRHGIGEAVWLAVSSLTGMHLAGRRAAVLGYGPVGRGLALWARHAGMAIEVVETDPIRRLFAHYDGFATPTQAEALQRVHVAVTATGRPGALTVAHLAQARDGLVLLNAGTGGDEVDVAGIRDAAEFVDHIDNDVVRYRLEGGSHVTVLGDGHPLNIVLNSGSPEPVLLQYAVLGLTLAWMMSEGLPPGETIVPATIEARAATAALSALDQPGL